MEIPDSLAVQMDRAFKAVVTILQEQADAIYQLQILSVTFGDVLRQALVRSGMRNAESIQAFSDARARALQSTPKAKAPNLAKEFELMIETLRHLERQLKKSN